MQLQRRVEGCLVRRGRPPVRWPGTARGRGCRRPADGAPKAATQPLVQPCAPVALHTLRAGHRGESPRCTASAAAQATGMAEVGVAMLERAAALGGWLRRCAIAPAPRRSAGSRRPGPWPRPAGRAPRLRPIPRTQACSVPQRPMPHITSSRISRMPWRAAQLAHAAQVARSRA